MLHTDLLKYTRAIRFYTVKPWKQGICKTIHLTIAYSIAFLLLQSETVKISPNCSYLPTKGLKISIFARFRPGVLMPWEPQKCSVSGGCRAFLTPSSDFGSMFPDSPIITSLSLDFQIRVSSLLYMFSWFTCFYFSKQVCKILLTFFMVSAIIHLSRKG